MFVAFRSYMKLSVHCRQEIGKEGKAQFSVAIAHVILMLLDRQTGSLI